MTAQAQAGMTAPDRLLASVLWSALVFALVFFVLGTKQPRRILIALVLAASVLSHWVLDLIVHTPDLPLTTDASMKVGLGLWHNAPITFALETVFLLGGLWLEVVPGNRTVV